LSLDPAAHVSDDQSIFGRNDPRCKNFKALAMTPSLVGVFDIPVTTASGTNIAAFDLRPNPVRTAAGGTGSLFDSWFSAACRCFLLWRGSIKYMFVFSASSYTTARFRLTYHPDPTIRNAESNQGGDVISQIIDIKGDTITKLTMPYLNANTYLRTPRIDSDSSLGENGWLVLSTVNRIIDNNPTITDASIQVSVWVSGGEDTDLAVPYTSASFASFDRAPSAIRPEGDICDVFKATFPPIIKASNKIMRYYTTSERELSIKTYLHRERRGFLIPSTTAFAPVTPYPSDFVSTGGYLPPPYTWFRFYRGSMRYRYQVNGGSTAQSTSIGYLYSFDRVTDTALHNFDAEIYSTTSANGEVSIHHVTLPYFANVKYIKKIISANGRGVYVVTPFFQVTNGDTWLTYSTGDDFTMGGLGTSPSLIDPGPISSSSTR